MNCPLCNSSSNTAFSPNGKTYYTCCDCGLTYMDSNNHLAAQEEEKRYSFHQNNIEDTGYVDFLNRIISPAMEYLSPTMLGLDYGCGPNPVLAQIVTEKGIKCDHYDPFFFPTLDASKKYDFIFATECFEHFFSPKKELNSICKLLNNEGYLCIMTELKQDCTDFAGWYYKNDPTHVCFYNEKTIQYICNEYNFKRIYTDGRRAIILKRI